MMARPRDSPACQRFDALSCAKNAFPNQLPVPQWRSGSSSTTRPSKTVFDQSLWPDSLRAGGELEQRVEEFTGLPELAGPNARTSFGGLEPAEHRLFARVSFDATSVSVARARAREVVVSLIELA